MSFLDKFMSIASGGGGPAGEGGTPSDPAPDTPEQTTTPGEQTPPGADQRPDGQAAQPTTYTPDELEQLLTDKKAEWLAEQEAAEQERLRDLPEKERLKREQIQKEDRIAQLEAELAKRDMQAAVIAKLEEQRLPASLSELVKYGDEKTTMESLDRVAGIVKMAVDEGVMLRLRGKTPSGLGMAATRENATTDPFAMAFSNALNN